MKLNFNKASSRRECGAATVEFAMIAIVLLMIIFGIIEFGILMFDQHVLTNASREGARAGIVMATTRVSEPEIKQKVEDYAKKFMVSFGASSGDLNTKVTWNGSPTMPPVLKFGDELVVFVTYKFDFLVLSIVLPDGIPLKAETRMRME